MIVALDPGRTAAACCAALVEGEPKVLSVSMVDGLNVGHAVRVLRAASELEETYGPVEFVVEGQWVPRADEQGKGRPRQNPATLEVLYESRFTWSAIARLLGIAVVVSKPATWQTVLKPIPRKIEDQKLTTKERSMRFARRWWRAVDNDHKADAIGMAIWRLQGGTTPQERKQ